jgi:hypothetical protein
LNKKDCLLHLVFGLGKQAKINKSLI